jgi:hypothetical protein
LRDVWGAAIVDGGVSPAGQGFVRVRRSRGLLAVAAALIAVVLVAVPARAQYWAQCYPAEAQLASPVQQATIFHILPPAGFFAMTAIGAAAIAPMVGTIVLGRELTISEFWHIELNLFLGPPGSMLADRMFPPGQGGPPGTPPGQGGNGNVHFPRPGEIHFLPNEVLIVFDAGASPAYIARLAARLHLTILQTQNFGLTGFTIVQFHIDGARSVASILRALTRYARIAAAQPNYLYLLQQGAPMVMRAAPPDAGAVQYVIGKLHLIEAHRISNGDNVGVAIIDSQVDTAQPELAGAIAGEFDAVGTPAVPHPHGTAIAGAIAAHAKLVGVAPKVRLFLARVFSGNGEIAQATTFNILKGIDWAASQNVRVVNMSFAGPSDPMMRDMLRKAHARGMVLVAAVGNGGARARPLYPAAYPDVIGVTATDADDKVMALANRGRQVAVAAPGVDIVAPAPQGGYQITSGTSIAAAHVSGVAALLLAEDANLKPDALKKILTGSAHALGRPAQEAGTGEIDALAALRALKK